MGNTIIIAINMNNSNALQRSAAETYIYGGAGPGMGVYGSVSREGIHPSFS